MDKHCEFCSHRLDDNFDCRPCMYMEPRPYADNTIVLKHLFILSPSIVFSKGTPKWVKEECQAAWIKEEKNNGKEIL